MNNLKAIVKPVDMSLHYEQYDDTTDELQFVGGYQGPQSRDSELDLNDPDAEQYGLAAWREEQRMLAQARTLLDNNRMIRKRRTVSERLERFIRRNKQVLEVIK